MFLSEICSTFFCVKKGWQVAGVTALKNLLLEVTLWLGLFIWGSRSPPENSNMEDNSSAQCPPTRSPLPRMATTRGPSRTSREPAEMYQREERRSWLGGRARKVLLGTQVTFHLCTTNWLGAANCVLIPVPRYCLGHFAQVAREINSIFWRVTCCWRWGSQKGASREAPCRGGRRSPPAGRPGTPSESGWKEIKHCYPLMPTLLSSPRLKNHLVCRWSTILGESTEY